MKYPIFILFSIIALSLFSKTILTRHVVNSDFVLFTPMWQVKSENYGQFEELIQPLYDQAATDTKAHFYQFSVTDNYGDKKISVRESYTNSNGFMEHFTKVKDQVDKSIQLSGAENASIVFWGNQKDVDAITPVLEKSQFSNHGHFLIQDGGFVSDLKKEKGEDEHIFIATCIGVKKEAYTGMTDKFNKLQEIARSECEINDDFNLFYYGYGIGPLTKTTQTKQTGPGQESSETQDYTDYCTREGYKDVKSAVHAYKLFQKTFTEIETLNETEPLYGIIFGPPDKVDQLIKESETLESYNNNNYSDGKGIWFGFDNAEKGDGDL